MARLVLLLRHTRPQHQFQVDGNHFMGKQELKFGFQYRHTIVNSLTAWPGNKVIADVDNELAYITRVGATKMKEQIVSGYVGDTLSWNRVTASLNLRWDRQWGNNEATPAPRPTRFSPTLLPALSLSRRRHGLHLERFLAARRRHRGARRTRARPFCGRTTAATRRRSTPGLISFNNPLYTHSELDYGWTDTNATRSCSAASSISAALAGSYYVDPDNPDVDCGAQPNRFRPEVAAFARNSSSASIAS